MKRFLRQGNFSTELLVFNMIAVGIVMIVLLYVLLVVQGSFVSYSLAAFGCLSMVAFYRLYLIHFEVEYELVLDDDNHRLIITNRFKKQRYIAYSEICEVASNWHNPTLLSVRYSSVPDIRQFKLDNLFKDLGYIVENILLRAEKLRTLSLHRNSLAANIWQKNPDWTIINTAKRRAEENRMKAMSPTPQASPAASAPPLAGGAPVRAEGDTTPPPL